MRVSEKDSEISLEAEASSAVEVKNSILWLN